MKKEDLIISLLKSKESIAELFNNNNNNNNNDNNNNLYHNELSDIRRIINRSRDVLPKKDRKEIKDKLYKIDHRRNISEEEQDYLIKLARILYDKEEHSLYDRDYFHYYGIRDIENLFYEASEEDYYEPIFVKISCKGNDKHYASNGVIEKNYQRTNILTRLDRIYMIW